MLVNQRVEHGLVHQAIRNELAMANILKQAVLVERLYLAQFKLKHFDYDEDEVLRIHILKQ